MSLIYVLGGTTAENGKVSCSCVGYVGVLRKVSGKLIQSVVVQRRSQWQSFGWIALNSKTKQSWQQNRRTSRWHPRNCRWHLRLCCFAGAISVAIAADTEQQLPRLRQRNCGEHALENVELQMCCRCWSNLHPYTETCRCPGKTSKLHYSEKSIAFWCRQPE